MCPSQSARKIVALLFKGTRTVLSFCLLEVCITSKTEGKGLDYCVTQNCCNIVYYCYKSESVDGCSLFRIYPQLSF